MQPLRIGGRDRRDRLPAQRRKLLGGGVPNDQTPRCPTEPPGTGLKKVYCVDPGLAVSYGVLKYYAALPRAFSEVDRS